MPLIRLPLFVQRFLNRFVCPLDDWGHDHVPNWAGPRTRLSRLVCDQADYLYTGMDDTRRF